MRAKELLKKVPWGAFKREPGTGRLRHGATNQCPIVCILGHPTASSAGASAWARAAGMHRDDATAIMWAADDPESFLETEVDRLTKHRPDDPLRRTLRRALRLRRWILRQMEAAS